MLVISRLERLSADSAYAHRASGIKGALLRYLDKPQSDVQNTQADNVIDNDKYLAFLIDQGYLILKKAAEDIQSYDNMM